MLILRWTILRSHHPSTPAIPCCKVIRAKETCMNPRYLSFVAAFAVVLPLASGLAVAQSKTSEGVLTASYKTPNYKAPRTADGRPDLQGVWANNNATPLQRPKVLKGKEFLSEQELTAIKRAADDLFKDGNSDAAFGDAVFLAALANAQGKMKGYVTADGKVGDYSSVWTVNRDWTNRTSLIIDPKDGKLPALTARAQELAKRPSYVENDTAFGQGPGKRPDGPEDLGLSVRCITQREHCEVLAVRSEGELKLALSRRRGNDESAIRNTR
jgi:hypothetical protein